MNRSSFRLRTVGQLALAGLPMALAPSAAAASPLQTSGLDQVGIPFCSGDGCPCGNDVADAGCGNDGLDGDLTTGGRLGTNESADVVADDLQIVASGLAPGAAALLFMGSPEPSVRSGDGLLCIGAGSTGLYRFPLSVADANGNVTISSIVATSQTLAGGAAAIQAGDTRAFQLFYRDAFGPCMNAFNATNGVEVTFTLPAASAPEEYEMGGRPLATFPFFERVDAINEGDPLYLTLDTTPIANQIGMDVDLYVVAAKTAAEWAADPTLVDARGAAQAYTIIGGPAANDIVQLDAGTLQGTPAPGPGGDAAGTAYDIVVDANRNGVLDVGDQVDGSGDEPAIVVMRDTVAPSQHGVTSELYDGGTFRRQIVYYPNDIATLGRVPLVIVSHGNGHDYRWYDYIGEHLASYGYVVMSHQNNTVPGIETASLTTLENTDEFLGNLDTIAGGVLEGHIDASRIAWIGHSRGAEGIARAYQRLITGEFTPVHYGPNDVRLLSSMAPTVFLSLPLTNPRGVPLHLWTGSADDDVHGASSSSGVVRSFVVHERADAERMVTALHGAGHAVFHDSGHGGRVADGPCLLTFAQAHEVIRAHFVHLMAHYLRDEPGVKDFFWRQYESFAPIGIPDTPCLVVNQEFREGPLDGNYVIDDMQTNSDPMVSSSGGAVSFDVLNLTENRLRDGDNTMSGSNGDPFNGMSRVKGANDTSRGITFDWTAPSFLEFELPAGERDVSGGRFLSFRAAQRAREANTIAKLADLTFRVGLEDGAGQTSSIDIGAYGGGIEEPYQRTGFGTGVGWSNEFEVIRIRLRDFLADGTRVNLEDLVRVRFDFGGPGVSPEGSIGLDEILITAR
ncbi:MAG: hypothetical protein AAGG01_03855 [Planctomycetota bacterium]